GDNLPAANAPEGDYAPAASANGRRRSRSSGKHARSHWHAPSGKRSHDNTTKAGSATLIATRTTAGPPNSGHRTRTGKPSGGSQPTRGDGVSPSDHAAAALSAVVAQGQATGKIGSASWRGS